mmetsp:Transcript_17281/g.51292  ORF Transcript_17281/g.51292 Transcript_17281/m.51292 type:complete len:419 (+) Transcript_17281:829-2085(+)
MRAGLCRPQVLLPAALHHRRRAQGGHHLAVQVPARAPGRAPRRRQGAHLLGQLLLAQAAAEPRRRDGRLPPKVPKDLAERLQGDGRGDAGLPLLPHLPHLHTQVHAQGAPHLHAERPGASRLLRVPQQGRRPHGRALPQQAHRQQDGEGSLGRRAALLCARRRRGQDDGLLRLAQPDLFDDGRVLGRDGGGGLLRQPVRRRGAVRALPQALAGDGAAQAAAPPQLRLVDCLRRGGAGGDGARRRLPAAGALLVSRRRGAQHARQPVRPRRPRRRLRRGRDQGAVGRGAAAAPRPLRPPRLLHALQRGTRRPARAARLRADDRGVGRERRRRLPRQERLAFRRGASGGAARDRRCGRWGGGAEEVRDGRPPVPRRLRHAGHVEDHSTRHLAGRPLPFCPYGSIKTRGLAHMCTYIRSAE